MTISVNMSRYVINRTPTVIARPIASYGPELSQGQRKSKGSFSKAGSAIFSAFGSEDDLRCSPRRGGRGGGAGSAGTVMVGAAALGVGTVGAGSDDSTA
jgi:hypothetical protein